MSDRSGIEWTDATWNPIVGCSIVSPGCTNCYAMKQAARIEKMHEGADRARIGEKPGAMRPSRYAGLTAPSKAGPIWTGEVALVDDHALTAPLRWKRPRRIFVNSMGDLFHESVPDEWIDRVFAVTALAPKHTFQVLTKRAKRMREYMAMRRGNKHPAMLYVACLSATGTVSHPAIDLTAWPAPNVWLGVSAEDQARADERIPDLLATPAAVRFVSAEPLLGPIDFTMIPTGEKFGEHDLCEDALRGPPDLQEGERLDWVIVGGESGPGARPMHPDWARSVRNQCEAAGVPFFFKQWGEWHLPDAFEGRENIGETTPFARVGRRRAGRLLDGRSHSAMPSASW